MTTATNHSAASVVFRDQVLASFVGEAPVLRNVLGQLPELAASDASVLVEGETGTGKELVARAIHYLGPRAPYPFIPANCGAFTESLLQDELFGHERGAYTDASARRPGLITQAEQGTLFLDEVDALTPRAQVSLLRVLQDGSFRALGGTREQRVNVRFVAATNTPLLGLVEEGRFRRDLYYRLCVFSIALPPLRERGEDVLRLAHYFIRKHGKDSTELSPDASNALLTFDWPGNVRELENAIIRGVTRARNGIIEGPDLGLPGQVGENGTSPSGGSFNAKKRRMIEIFERQLLTELMSQHKGNVTRAAAAAGRERRDFGKLLKKHSIDPSIFSTPRKQASGSIPDPRQPHHAALSHG